jgi:hypothetical protein
MRDSQAIPIAAATLAALALCVPSCRQVRAAL